MTRQAEPWPSSGAGRRSFWLPWGLAVLALALACRLLWLAVFQGEIGGDAIRYLWISEHVRQGRWLLVPQLFSSPLLPVSIGLLSHLTGEAVLAARLIGIVGNTLAVALAMAWVRRLLPQQPLLAWLTGAGLAVNHVWCRLAPFALTENLFYPLLMGLLGLALLLRERTTWPRGLAFGLVWSLLYFSREIGLFSGAAIFALLLLSLLRQAQGLRVGLRRARPLLAGALPLALLLVGLWVFWFYQAFGIISLGEGHRFYAEYCTTFDRSRENEYPGYKQGEIAFFRLRPYEMMEYTRCPRPGEARYPQAGAVQLLSRPATLAGLIWDNLTWSLKAFQKVTLPGFIMLLVILPVGWLRGRVRLPAAALFLFAASSAVLGLHFLGPVREARLIGWFFPWLYLALAVLWLWLWNRLPQVAPAVWLKKIGGVLLAALLAWHLCYPQYFKEVPRRWAVRLEPHIHTQAAAFLLQTAGPGQVLSSREAEMAYRAQAFWIGQPQGSPAELVEWLYLGGADYFLRTDKHPETPAQQIFWAELDVLRRAHPELELLAEFNAPRNQTYGRRARLFRFHPDPARFQAYKQQYPWAGTHPRATWAVGDQGSK